MSGRLTGRAGRLQLVHRLETARRGCDLLERKRRILAEELSRLRLLSAQTQREWAEVAAEAARWAARSLALDGAQRIVDSAPSSPATVMVTWRGAMGVIYPDTTVVSIPAPEPVSASSSLLVATRVYRVAVVAAARHAAATRALALVEVELEATRLRQRAIERRWIPRLETNLRELGHELDEQERQENVRLRWATGAAQPGSLDGAGGTGRSGAMP
jgi:vacuolar-type H+-ATPase subunit D/Vma8